MGTEINTVEGNRVRSQTTFRFQDGSIDDEVAVFTQERVFQLVSDHHIQKGPSFPEPMDLSINVPAKSVSWREMKKGKVERHTDHMRLVSAADPREFCTARSAIFCKTKKGKWG